MKILAIGAHPDDIEIFMFGLLTLFKERGDQVCLMIATDGSKGGANKGRGTRCGSKGTGDGSRCSYA